MDSPLNGQGDITFPPGQGFRPYRTEVGIRAHSGTTVGDLGRCAEETEAGGGGGGNSCEIFQARGVATLARTATSVTLFAGHFVAPGPFDRPRQATLTAFTANGTVLTSTGPVPIDANGFNTRLSVSNPQGRIASFTIEATSGVNADSIDAGDLGIDDLTVNFADGGLADFSVAPATNQILALVQGEQREVPVRITRVNGSNGPIELSVLRLPKGVSAAPVTVLGNQTTATITLIVAPTAPDTEFKITEATITADPLGDPNVGSGPRTAQLLMRVAKEFELSAGGLSEKELGLNGSVEVAYPDCAPVEVPVKITRDIAMNREITLSLGGRSNGNSSVDPVTGLPPGVSAEILPSPVIPTFGGLAAERTLRFKVNSTKADFSAASITIEGRAGSDPAPSHSIRVSIRRATPTATISGNTPGSGYLTPRFGKKGTPIRIHGSGFCPGTTVDVGNEYAPVPATLVDEHTIEVNVPQKATSGKLLIRPPEPTPPYRIENILAIDSFRNVNGFQFDNYDYHSVSLGELVKAFGADDLFIKVNPCWPFGSCPVPSGILSPTAAIDWAVFNAVARKLDVTGHCFGMSLAVRQFITKKEPLRQFTRSGTPFSAQNVHELGYPYGPGVELNHFLDALHIRQFSAEGIQVWFNRPKSLNAQLKTIEEGFRHQQPMLISDTANDPFSAHVTLAYDIKQDADSADIYVYDSNSPFQEGEATDPFAHSTQLDRDVIHIDKREKTWKKAWEDAFREGGNDGSLWAMPLGTPPDDPSLPGVSTLKGPLAWFLYGSSVGAVRAWSEGHFMPIFGASPSPAAAGSRRVPASAGSWIDDDTEHPLEVNFLGLKPGTYTQSYTAPGFVAAVTDVSTDKDVRDTVKGVDDSLTFESGTERPLTIDLSKTSGPSMSTAATLETHASADGTDTAGFSADSALTYAHDGAPIKIDFTLTTVRRDGGPATFVSGPVPVGRGDRLWAEPLDRELRKVKLTVRDAAGRTTTRVLRNRGRQSGRLKLGAVRVSKHRLSMPIEISGLQGRAIVGTSLRLMRNGHLVARKAMALKGSKETRKVSWRLPRSLGDGRYRLLADARAVTTAGRGSTAAASVSGHWAGWVRVGR